MACFSELQPASTTCVAMSSSAVHPCLLLLCLLLVAPQLGSCYHTTRHRYSEAPCMPPGSSGVGGLGGWLPVMHRLGSCSSPAGAAASAQTKPSLEDISNRDALRLSMLFEAIQGSKASVSSTGPPRVNLPSPSDYHFTLGYGTPVQTIVVGFDTGPVTRGATQLQCKPCVGTGAPCDLAFDPSNSTSLKQVTCGSPDCPITDCSGKRCMHTVSKGNTVYNATFVTDTLTHGPSRSFENFRVVCMEMAARAGDISSSGIIDFSRDSHSLLSQVPLSSDNVTFSYCLPSYATWNLGFWALGGARPEKSDLNVTYATLQSNATHPALYSIKLAGISIAGTAIRIPPVTLVGDTLFDVQTTFTYLKQDVYTILREEFKGSMKAYRQLPSLGQLDTCYDFTGLVDLNLPGVTLNFDGGASMDLHITNYMYFENREKVSVGCLAFAAAPTNTPVVAVIGTMVQGMTEMVYDVLGGKIGVIPLRC